MPVKIKNGTEFIINGEKWMYLHYAFHRHLLTAINQTQIDEIKRNDGSVYKTVTLIHKLVGDEQMRKLREEQ